MSKYKEPNIRVGVAVMVTDSHGRLLLGKRGKQPNCGKWVLPGGGIKYGEHWYQAAKREIKEETGLKIKLTRDSITQAIEITTPNKGGKDHRIVLITSGYVIGGKLKANSDLLDAQFFYVNELTELSNISKPVRSILNYEGWLDD